MNFEYLKKISSLEIACFFMFGAYIIFPISTPICLVPFIHSSVGLSILMILALYCVFYFTPVLGILSILVAYEIVRRSSSAPRGDFILPHIHSSMSQSKKNKVLKRMNPTQPTSLEEEMVHQMAPIESLPYLQTSFNPVSDKIAGGALI